MQITVDLPKDIAQRPDPAREALEALAIEGYRSGALTSFETRRLLGFETRHELDGFLKAHNVWAHAYSIEDFERDCETLQEQVAQSLRSSNSAVLRLGTAEKPQSF
jgi:predicted HTH domain antitoxin